MSLQITTNISVDFYDKKYTMINAKQYDNGSRWVAMTCYDNGNVFNLNASKHTAYIKYKKPDGHTGLNSCRINSRGEVLVELTGQMLAAYGTCYVDLVIVSKGEAIVDIDNGKITTIDNSPILSATAFCISVYESAVDNSLIESSTEYSALNELLTDADANYQEVIQLARSYAIGDADNIRENENQDNAKYYCEQASNRAGESKASEDAAKASEVAALDSEQKAKTSETNASNSASAALISETNAKASEEAALSSEQNAKTSETNSKTSEGNAKDSEIAAKTSETNSKTSETNAANSETNAKVSEESSKASETKAKEYCEMVKSVADGLNSGFIPIGTITFAELATAEKATGFTYNIKDDFVTDDTFREGAGMTYTAGTNVYFTASGEWDAFGGSASPTATVDEVKDYLGI